MDFRGPLYVILAFLAYAVLHSAMATQRAKNWAQSNFGEAGRRYYRLIYNALGGVTLLPVLALLAAYPGEELYRLSSPWLILALILQALGALIILIGLMQTGVGLFLGLDRAVDEQNPGPERLVTRGLYRWMRHPLYTGGLLFIWFVPLMTTSLLAFNLSATVYLYVGSIFEERRLIRSFGDRYRSYQNQVPRLIPLPWKRYSSPRKR